MTLFNMDGHPIGGSLIYERQFEDAWISIVPSLSAMTMFYTGRGNALISIGEFTKVKGGVIALETTKNGGKSWQFRDFEKLGRGMNTSVTAAGPCQFRCPLDDDGKPSGIRVVAKDLFPMEPIEVRITFAGAVFRHFIRTESEYLIQEEP